MAEHTDEREKAKQIAEQNEDWRMTDDSYENGWSRGFDVGYDAAGHAEWVDRDSAIASAIQASDVALATAYQCGHDAGIAEERARIGAEIERCISEYKTPRAQVLSIKANVIDQLRAGKEQNTND